MSLAVAEAVKARLAAQIPTRTVYANAVPEGTTLPAQYLVVWTSNGDEFASAMCDVTDIAVPVVWVTSVSRNAKPEAAAREAAWGADKARTALRDWRSGVGPVSWKLRAVASSPPTRDESLDVTTFYAVEQFTAQHQL